MTVMRVFRKCCHCVPFIFWISKYQSKMCTFQLSVQLICSTGNPINMSRHSSGSCAVLYKCFLFQSPDSPQPEGEQYSQCSLLRHGKRCLPLAPPASACRSLCIWGETNVNDSFFYHDIYGKCLRVISITLAYEPVFSFV